MARQAAAMTKPRSRDSRTDAFSETGEAKPVAPLTGTMMAILGYGGIEG